MRARAGTVATTVLLGLAALFATAAPAAALRVDAPAAIVMESTTGDVAFSRAADDRRSIASATKLMTALLTLQRRDLDDVLRAVDYAAGPAESQIGLIGGERMTVRDLLRALLIPSANDAAAALAAGVGGSQARFVRLMNQAGARLGLSRTRFSNPVGLDDSRNFSTARDLASLAVRLRRNAFFRETVNLGSVTLRSGARPRTVFNRNTLVRRFDWVNGVKTGRTNRAGHVLVASASRMGVTVVSVVLGERTERARNDDTLALLRYGLARYRRVTGLLEGRVLARPTLRYRDGETVEVVAARAASHVVRRGEALRLAVNGVPDELDGPLPKGSRVGTALIYHRGEVVDRVPLVTAHAVTEAGFGTRVDHVLQRPIIVAALLALLACSLPLVALRRRAIRRRQHLDAGPGHGAGRREETPVA